MTRRKIVFRNKLNNTWYASEEYNGDREQFERIGSMDSCDKSWPEIMEVLNGVSSMADFLKVIPQINRCYHSVLEDSARLPGMRLGIAHDLNELAGLVAGLDEVYLIVSGEHGVSRLPMWEDKPVLDENTFSYDSAKPGDLVTQGVVDDAMDCLPPACYCEQCCQMGEPYSSRYDDWTGKWRTTFQTFRKVGGTWPDSIWEYCGDCFMGETEQRGAPMQCVAGV